MQKIVVTGGAGFIGSHLVDSLLNEGNSVIVIDDFSVGLKSNLSEHPNLSVTKANILGDIGRYFKGVDTVFHLAALTRPRWSIKHPEETNKVNVEGTIKVLKACLDNKVGKLVFISSASVYGKQNKLTLSENLCLRPTSPYALTKQIGEKYCELYADLYGLKYDIVRLFNVYGERQSLCGEYSSVVLSFISRLENGETPYISGSGKQGRDFVYVKDVARLLTLFAKRKGNGEVYNVGSGTCTSVNSLYRLICKLMKKDTKPGYRKPTSNISGMRADISKAKRLLGWEPKVDLKEGLKRTIGKNLI